ncbi:unnamed protein product, partial [Musa textilis]
MGRRGAPPMSAGGALVVSAVAPHRQLAPCWHHPYRRLCSLWVALPLAGAPAHAGRSPTSGAAIHKDSKGSNICCPFPRLLQ